MARNNFESDATSETPFSDFSLMTTSQYYNAGMAILGRKQTEADTEFQSELEVATPDDYESVQASYPGRPEIPHISRGGI